MTLPIPFYVRMPGLLESLIRYTWDDWNIEAVDLPLDPDLLLRLHAMSQRAVVALAIGIAEWIIYRFSSLASDVLPRQYLESAWAQVVDFRYGTHYDINPDDWRGPVRGPIGTAIRRVKFAVQQAELNGEPSWRTARISKLAEHVLPSNPPYIGWRDRMIDRFVSLYPFDPEETLGDVVHWQFVDPEMDANLDDTEKLINEFLRSLDYRRNPFLNSPTTMIANGFEGRPYEFDVTADRRRRFDW